MWFGKVKSFCFKILYETLPTYLLHKLKNCYLAVGPWNNFTPTDRGTLVGVQRVFDLGNCGPRSQYMVGEWIAHNCNYGAGAPKIHKSLLQAGFDVTLGEVYGYHRAFWQAYAGIKHFEKKLQNQWYLNNGVLTNGRGRPLGVDEDSLKDLVNRFVQSTGHDLLLYYLDLLIENLQENDIPWQPYIVDLHDEVILQVPENQAEVTAQVLSGTMDQLNEVLKWDVKFSGTPTVGRNLAEIKLAG
jgi:hypothetical protein